MRAVEEAPRGVLDLRSGRGRFDVTRTRPVPALAELVEHFWTVSWDLRGRDPHTQHTLPHPSVHLVAERDRSGVMGVLTGRFTRELEGEGRAFGIRFRPAGFHPFLGAPVATLTDRRVAVAEVFGPAGDRLVADLLAAAGQARLVAAAEAFLLARLPAADPNVVRVNRVVDQLMADRDITRVADVTGRSGIAARRLQRLFATYVGVTPKVGHPAGPPPRGGGAAGRGRRRRPGLPGPRARLLRPGPLRQGLPLGRWPPTRRLRPLLALLTLSQEGGGPGRSRTARRTRSRKTLARAFFRQLG
jgi:hypothetical protein